MKGRELTQLILFGGYMWTTKSFSKSELRSLSFLKDKE